VSARRLPPFVAALFFTLRDSYGWQHCRPVCSEARYSSRIAFFAYPTCIRRPLLGGFASEYRHSVWHGKTRMVCLPDSEKFWYVYSFWHNSRTWQTDTHTQRHTDTAWRHRPHLCIASRSKTGKFMLSLSIVWVVMKRTDLACGWLWKEPVVWLDHSRCSKLRPFAFTHARSRVCRWSMALSMMPWGIRSQVSMLQLVNVTFRFLCNVR